MQPYKALRSIFNKGGSVMIIDCDTHLMPRDAFDRVGDDFSQRANPKISEAGKELIRWGTASRLFHLDGSPANG